ncbi:MAG TPA: hypothetical protein VJ775_00005, partial [Sphingomicrobium sp.]|nr:hypothetical protein [Sphingomicrobium sp.]
EPRRAYRRSRIPGLPGQEDETAQPATSTTAQVRERSVRPQPRPATQPATPPAPAAPALQNQAGIY